MAIYWNSPVPGTRAALMVAAIALMACGAGLRAAEAAGASSPQPKVRDLSGHYPDKPSVSPSFVIPVESLGFAAPGPIYLGQRNSLASLDFIGEDRLLFTFRVPVLLRRPPGSEGDSDEREIRAVVLSLPAGTLEAETNWLVHDRSRYLWMMHDGHFLLRDRDSLVEGDATLKTKPYLHFPGPLLSIELDPKEQFLATSSREPAAKPEAQPDGGGVDQEGAPDLVLRVLKRDSGQVLLVTRVASLIHLPINSDGFVAPSHDSNIEWSLMMNSYGGGQKRIGTVKSACMPNANFVSDQLLLATACSDQGDDALVAMTMTGQTLWANLVPDRMIWPLLRMAANGSRIVRETLYSTHAIDNLNPMGTGDIKGQVVQVFDAATGAIAFESGVTPVLDAGGNVAISPSGQRVAVLTGNSIEVFVLPPAPGK